MIWFIPLLLLHWVIVGSLWMAQFLHDIPIGPLPSYVLVFLYVFSDCLHFFSKGTIPSSDHPLCFLLPYDDAPVNSRSSLVNFLLFLALSFKTITVSRWDWATDKERWHTNGRYLCSASPALLCSYARGAWTDDELTTSDEQWQVTSDDEQQWAMSDEYKHEQTKQQST